MWDRHLVTQMRDISEIDASITYNSNCIDNHLAFSNGHLWIKSFNYDSTPQVKINSQESDVFYFQSQYNLIGVSISPEIYKSFGLRTNINDQAIKLGLSVNEQESMWTITPDITIKRVCNGSDFQYSREADMESYFLKGSAKTTLPTVLLYTMFILFF